MGIEETGLEAKASQDKGEEARDVQYTQNEPPHDTETTDRRGGKRQENFLATIRPTRRLISNRSYSQIDDPFDGNGTSPRL